jgi:hypothetical protein
MRTSLRGQFPDQQGKYRELQHFGRIEAELQPKKPCLLGIPYSTEQGILKREQGIILPEQAIFFK